MNTLKHIPNLITLCNLVCGCTGIALAFKGNLHGAVFLIWLGMFFDFFDGLAARLLHVSSAIGKELDSLADMVSFGVLPAVIMYHLLGVENYMSYVAVLIAVFSALRLAKFNVDYAQQADFIGLPTPANALFISSLVFVRESQVFGAMLSDVALVAITIIFSLLLVAPVRLFSLKFKNLRWAENQTRMIFLLLSAVLLLSLQIVGLPFVILLYILMSFIENGVKASQT